MPVPQSAGAGMTLSEARTAFIHAERLAIQFPRNAACQRMRVHCYAGWLRAVRAFRNGDVEIKMALDRTETTQDAFPAAERPQPRQSPPYAL